MTTRPFFLGRSRPVTTDAAPAAHALPAHHLVTHGVCVGMTGSGKTGLCLVLVEEALRSGVPVLMVDVKGDLPNLLLAFPQLAPAEFAPWIDPDAARRAGRTVDEVATETATRWRDGLAAWDLGPADVAALRAGIAPRVITPGTSAGESLHVLSALESPSPLWRTDEETARESLSAALSLLLRFLQRDGDAARSREHVLLAHLAERRLRAGQRAGLDELVADLQRPPLARVGALALDDFLPPAGRAALAQDLNTLIASPTFATWRQGAALDVGAWLTPRDARTPAVIVSVAHLDDDERMLVLSLVLEQTLAWVRTLPGTSDLRALVLFDEVFGFLPPHPAAPPTKRPLLALMKQARAFGVGVVVATQNPMDLDYKALSNAGVWFVGRLQTDADRERVVDGLAGASHTQGDLAPAALAAVLKNLPKRTFYVRDTHDADGHRLLATRWTLSWLRGPVTRQEIRRLLAPPPAPPAPPPPSFAAPPSSFAAPPEAAPRALAPTMASAPPAPPPPGALDASAPPSPEGWRAWFAPAPPDLAPPWRYEPWVGATLVAHVRNDRLGVHATRTVRAMAPLQHDGRPDTARGRPFDPRWCAPAPAPAVPFSPLPDGLHRRGGTAAVEKALREEVYRSLKVTVQVHPELGLVSGDGEAPEAFALRCQAEAARRAAAEREAVATRHAARIQKQADRVAAARNTLAAAEASSPVGSGVATVAAMLTGNKRVLRRLETQQDRQAAKREKARADLARAEADHREALAKRDADLADAARAAQSATAGVEARLLGVRREDVQVAEVGLVWVPTG